MTWTVSNRFNRTSRRGLASVIALVLLTALAPSIVPSSAAASSLTEEELLELKKHWQEKYRWLLTERARLSRNIEIHKNNYAQAQRRNYPRGGAREQFLLDAKQAEEDLAKIEEEIGTIFVDARDADVPPAWLYDVEDEPIPVAKPAAPATGDEPSEDREGRNPLYLEDDEK